MIKALCSLLLLIITGVSYAQCDSVTVAGDLTVSSDQLMSGTYVVEGTFTIQAGVTVFVTPYSNNGCGELKIYAENIAVEGAIDGNFSGYEGGAGGGKGFSVNSMTGNATSLTTCDNSGSEGHISIEGGFGGVDGNGPGAGTAGGNATKGEGSKQYCGNFGDEAGLVGSPGGAGGGAGGSYGNTGTAGADGGAGSNVGTPNGIDVENSYGAVSGNGGTGGTAGIAYGTENGRDIQLGSGGAGSGGGGRSYYLGADGTNGGNGGGLVFLKADNSLTISGAITVNGGNGSIGGNGGSGDATDDCCSDGCNGCDERTYSCGAGAGSGSGGGSGGGIFIESLGAATISGTLSAIGGSGGDGGQKGLGATCDYSGGGFCSGNSMTTSDGQMGGSGGAGSGGRVKVFVADCAMSNITGNITVAGGVAGVEGTYAEICGYVSLDELAGTFQWMVYPNPFSSNVTVQLPTEVSGANVAEILIFNSLGTIVYIGQTSNSQTTINLDNLEIGVYFVQVAVNGQTAVKKLMKR